MITPGSVEQQAADRLATRKPRRPRRTRQQWAARLGYHLLSAFFHLVVLAVIAPFAVLLYNDLAGDYSAAARIVWTVVAGFAVGRVVEDVLDSLAGGLFHRLGVASLPSPVPAPSLEKPVTEESER